MQVDVYSFAMILFQLFEHMPPFAGVDPVEAAKAAALENARPRLDKLNSSHSPMPVSTSHYNAAESWHSVNIKSSLASLRRSHMAIQTAWIKYGAWIDFSPPPKTLNWIRRLVTGSERFDSALLGSQRRQPTWICGCHHNLRQRDQKAATRSFQKIWCGWGWWWLLQCHVDLGSVVHIYCLFQQLGGVH